MHKLSEHTWNTKDTNRPKGHEIVFLYFWHYVVRAIIVHFVAVLQLHNEFE